MASLERPDRTPAVYRGQPASGKEWLTWRTKKEPFWITERISDVFPASESPMTRTFRSEFSTAPESLIAWKNRWMASQPCSPNLVTTSDRMHQSARITRVGCCRARTRLNVSNGAKYCRSCRTSLATAYGGYNIGFLLQSKDVIFLSSACNGRAKGGHTGMSLEAESQIGKARVHAAKFPCGERVSWGTYHLVRQGFEKVAIDVERFQRCQLLDLRAQLPDTVSRHVEFF